MNFFKRGLEKGLLGKKRPKRIRFWWLQRRRENSNNGVPIQTLKPPYQEFRWLLKGKRKEQKHRCYEFFPATLKCFNDFLEEGENGSTRFGEWFV